MSITKIADTEERVDCNVREKEGRLITDTFPDIHLYSLKFCGSISPPTCEEI